MRFLIKLALIGALVVFALVNYRIYSFEKGLSKTKMGDKSFVEVVSTIAGIEKVEYYENGSTSNENIYNVYIVTHDDAYLFRASEKDMTVFKVAGLFSDKISPEKISPIPFYVEIIAGVIILLLPFGKKKKA